MANYNYFAFTEDDPVDKLSGGILADYVNNNGVIAPAPIGELCQPNEIIKLSPNNDLNNLNYSQIDDYIDFTISGENVRVAGLTELDWNEIDDIDTFKEVWFKAWMNHVGLNSYTTEDIFNTLIADFENDDGFQKLSGPSVAYMHQNTETLEVTLGLNAYESNFWLDWIATHSTNPYSTEIRKSLTNLPHFISHIAKITYSNDTHNTWSFDTRKYSTYSGPGVENGNILVGGGNYFTEIKFAGANYIIDNNLTTEFTKAKYVIKKNIDPRDPTFGLCSGEGEPFCVGDQLFVIDISIINDRIYSGTNAGFSWTWIGTPTDVDRKWHIANVSRPCTDYANIPINNMLFPLRVISECIFSDFN